MANSAASRDSFSMMKIAELLEIRSCDDRSGKMKRLITKSFCHTSQVKVNQNLIIVQEKL
jgi:hypothetical protein